MAGVQNSDINKKAIHIKYNFSNKEWRFNTYKLIFKKGAVGLSLS